MQTKETKQQQIEGSYIDSIVSAVQEINDAIAADHNQYLALTGLQSIDGYEMYLIDHSRFEFSIDSNINNMIEMFTKVLSALINFKIISSKRSFIIIIDLEKR